VNEIDELGLLIEEGAQALEHRIERDILGEKLQVREGRLPPGHALPHPHRLPKVPIA
jgi:hypothetical protein